MPRNFDIKKVLVIGSGPIIIGQAAEFDYAGTQACKTLKEEGIEVVLINSNPATIMTDANIANKIYIEPLNVDIIKKIIIKEKPDSILPTLGGQIALNLTMELYESGFLDNLNIKLLGTKIESIKKAEDRKIFKETMEKINEPCIISDVFSDLENALIFAHKIKFPVIIRPAYTLGGSGGGIANDEVEFIKIATNGLKLSRVNQILVERCISGWKEIEYEVIRDANNNVIIVCNMENMDPVGIHTGDSIVVAPSQTLTDKEYQTLRSSSLKIISELEIEGGCNVQFALNPNSFEYVIIEVNPRVSRSSALASKATGYPIAKVATKIAIGYHLDEIINSITGKTYACFEPTLDYVVLKIPRWPFDKFTEANRKLGTQMKATGEVMAISTSFEGALVKAIRSLELNTSLILNDNAKKLTYDEILYKLINVDDERIFILTEALNRGINPQLIHNITKIDLFFIEKINAIIKIKKTLELEYYGNKFYTIDLNLLKKIKKFGFTDNDISQLVNIDIESIKSFRYDNNIKATFKVVDTCAAEFKAITPYYYSTYENECEIICSDKEKVLIIGSGPIRIGQGIEFDYCSIHSILALKELGYETIIINNNPETISTDFDVADKLYFEPITYENVENIIYAEKIKNVIVQFGGQTALKMAKHLIKMGVKILGTSLEDIDISEDREKFDQVLEKINIRRPKGKTIFTIEEAIKTAKELQYPVLIRPSYVLGGYGMSIAHNEKDVVKIMTFIIDNFQSHPILIDKYLSGIEIEVDAIYDGEDTLIPGIMEHIEKAGIHSGDSISSYPPYSLSEDIKNQVIEYTKKLAKNLKVIGLMNIQYVLYDNELCVIEVNLRSSRTIPYISKVTGIPIVNLATKVIMGIKLKDLNFGTGLYKESQYCCLKFPVFSFEKLSNLDITLGPEMKSTGEILSISKDMYDAFYKGLISTNFNFDSFENGILLTFKEFDMHDASEIIDRLIKLNLKIYLYSQDIDILKDFNSNNILQIKNNDVEKLIKDKKISLIVNTNSKNNVNYDLNIKKIAIENFIPCITSIDTFQMMLKCLELNKNINDVDVYDLGSLN